MRGTSAVSRALAHMWRRSLQLRVVVLTLGLSAVVILVLGFVLTSQITNRVLEVKVRAATEEINRARGTVSGRPSGPTSTATGSVVAAGSAAAAAAGGSSARTHPSAASGTHTQAP